MAWWPWLIEEMFIFSINMIWFIDYAFGCGFICVAKIMFLQISLDSSCAKRKHLHLSCPAFHPCRSIATIKTRASTTTLPLLLPHHSPPTANRGPNVRRNTRCLLCIEWELLLLLLLANNRRYCKSTIKKCVSSKQVFFVAFDFDTQFFALQVDLVDGYSELELADYTTWARWWYGHPTIHTYVRMHDMYNYTAAHSHTFYTPRRRARETSSQTSNRYDVEPMQRCHILLEIQTQ